MPFAKWGRRMWLPRSHVGRRADESKSPPRQVVASIQMIGQWFINKAIPSTTSQPLRRSLHISHTWTSHNLSDIRRGSRTGMMMTCWIVCSCCRVHCHCCVGFHHGCCPHRTDCIPARDCHNDGLNSSCCVYLCQWRPEDLEPRLVVLAVGRGTCRHSQRSRGRWHKHE